VFHRCVVAVIGLLALSTWAAAGPIKFSEQGPSLEVTELRASGVRMSSGQLRAIFFRGGDARNATASCAECLSAESALNALERNPNSSYRTLFPFSSSSLYAKKPSRSTRTTKSVPDLLTGSGVEGAALLVADLPVSSSDLAAPLAVTAAAAVPEPGSVVLIGTGMAGLWLRRRRNRSEV
jgi:hypothetical protein